MSSVHARHGVAMDEHHPMAEDVLRSPDRILELADGKLIEKALGLEASWIATCISRHLFPFTEGKGLGYLSVASFVQAFREEPERVRRPAMMFATMSHFPGGTIPTGTLRSVPELIVEIVERNDKCDPIDARIDDYLNNGAKLVWLVMPWRRAIWVHRADGTIQRFRENDTITGESVVPEFSMRVKELFPPVQLMASAR